MQDCCVVHVKIQFFVLNVLIAILCPVYGQLAFYTPFILNKPGNVLIKGKFNNFQYPKLFPFFHLT